MTAVAQNQIKPFSSPAGALDPSTHAIQGRGNDNVIVSSFNSHDADPSIHIARQSTNGVSTGATAIYAAITGKAAAFIEGSTGSLTFVDVVAWNGTTNTKVVISSSSLDGSPAARTYSVVAGVLTLAMGSGTYAVSVCPVQFS